MTQVTVPQSPQHAMLDLTLLNAEAESATIEDMTTALLERGVPSEIVTRLVTLWEKTEMVAGELVAIGKIIIGKIVEFMEANPLIAAGLAVGAALAALIGALPVLGPLLAPVFTPIAVLLGGAVGANMQRGHDSGSIANGAVDLASKFFALLAAIINGVSAYWGSRDQLV